MAEYTKITPELAEELKALVGPGRFYYGAEVPDDYSRDEMPIYGKFAPEAVAEVETTEEVSKIMKIANQYKIPVVPWGGGSGSQGGAMPMAGGIILDMKRMNKYYGVDKESLTVRCQTGIIAKHLL